MNIFEIDKIHLDYADAKVAKEVPPPALYDLSVVNDAAESALKSVANAFISLGSMTHELCVRIKYFSLYVASKYLVEMASVFMAVIVLIVIQAIVCWNPLSAITITLGLINFFIFSAMIASQIAKTEEKREEFKKIHTTESTDSD